MTNRPPKFNLAGVWLAVPAVAFLLLYMTAPQFSLLDHAIAIVFVAILAYGTLALHQRQNRQRLKRIKTRDAHSRSQDKR
jgi:hypothetical protein